MRKRDELTAPHSCMSRARDSEMTFVLLGRDAAAPATIRFWVSERLRLRKNAPDDPQILEALACADTMDAERDELGRIIFANAMTDGLNRREQLPSS